MWASRAASASSSPRAVHRWQRWGVAAAAAVATVAVAGAIPGWLNSQRAEPAEPAAACAPRSAPTVPEVEPPTIPTGVDRLTVCGPHAGRTQRWVLRSDVEQIASRVRETDRRGEVCPAVAGLVYGYTFHYRTGRAVHVRLDTSGCGLTLQASVIEPTLRLLDAQRLSDAAGRPVRYPACEPASSVPRDPGLPSRFDPLARPAKFVPTYVRVVTACRYGWQQAATASVPGLQAQAQTQGPQLAALLAEVNASADVGGTSCTPGIGGVDVLLFADQAQGVVEVRVARQPCGEVHAAHRVGQATPRLLALLDALLGRPGQQSPSTTLPRCGTPLSAGSGAHPPVPVNPDVLRVCEGTTVVWDLPGAAAQQYARMAASAPRAAQCSTGRRLPVRQLIFVAGRSVTVLTLTGGDCPRLSTRNATWLAPAELTEKLAAPG